MTALVPSSARAQAADTDLDGLNVRSNAATGARGGRCRSRVVTSARAPSRSSAGSLAKRASTRSSREGGTAGGHCRPSWSPVAGLVTSISIR